jgi:acyl-CoA thioester hydrolase
MRTYSGVVYPSQCDAMGHMNVQHYVAAFDQAMWHLVYSLGYRPEWQTTKAEGWADVRHDVTFSKELKPGNLFYIESGVIDCGIKSLTSIHQLLTVEGEIAAKDEIKSVYFSLAARKAIALPTVIKSAVSQSLSVDGPRIFG